MNGAQALIKALERQGVEIIFGYPGGAVLPLYDALPDSKIKHVLTRSEQSAAHSAAGYARSTGKVGVCLATSGPGATNLLTGIANAYLDSISIVAITGQVATDLIGHDVFQEVDMVGATTPFTKYNYLIKNAGDVPSIVDEAFFIASSGRKGPVHIDFPSDIQKAEGKFKFDGNHELRSYKPNTEPNNRQLKKLEEAIDKCSRPLVCVGGGCMISDLSEKILKFAERINAPFVTTLPGVGAMPTGHKGCLGMIGQSGLHLANKVAENADLIIVLGTRLGDRTTGNKYAFAKNANIAHIDIDPAEIGKNHRAYIPIVADLEITLSKLLEMDIRKSVNTSWSAEIAGWKKKYYDATGASGERGLDPKEIIGCISDLCDENVLLTTDVGQHQVWTGRYIKTKAAGNFITSGGLGTMGFSLPSAMGAALGNPRKRVVTVVGDGGFQMCFNELATLKQEGVRLGIALFNNSCLGMVRELQQVHCGGRYNQVALNQNPDFSSIAKAYGIEYIRASTSNEIAGAVKRLLAPDTTIIVEFDIDPEANVIPLSNDGEQL